MKRMQSMLMGACMMLFAIISESAYAAWPEDQPIKIIVPQPAGGTNDTVARLIGVELAKALGQSVVVENRPGAASAIGMQAAARAAPDGYTLAIASDTAAILSATRKNLPWRLDQDFTGLAMIGDQPIGIAVPADSPYQSLRDLLAAAKAKPDSIAFGTSGLGTAQHIVGEWLVQEANVRMIHVPYKGGGQAIIDLVGGTIPAAVLGFVPLLNQERNKGVRILAITTAERNDATPNIPTLTELGFTDIEQAQWAGLVAPKDTPPAVIERISSAVTEIIQRPEIKVKLLQAGLTPRPASSPQFDAFLKKEIPRWASLVKQLNINLN